MSERAVWAVAAWVAHEALVGAEVAEHPTAAVGVDDRGQAAVGGGGFDDGDRDGAVRTAEASRFIPRKRNIKAEDTSMVSSLLVITSFSLLAMLAMVALIPLTIHMATRSLTTQTNEVVAIPGSLEV